MSLEKADEFMNAAVSCFEQGYPNASASRCYYAMFHAAVAVLHAFGIRSGDKWSHEGLHAAFSRELIHRRKVMPAHLASYLSDVMRTRVRADYAPDTITSREVQRALRQAQEFLRAIKERLP